MPASYKTISSVPCIHVKHGLQNSLHLQLNSFLRQATSQCIGPLPTGRMFRSPTLPQGLVLFDHESAVQLRRGGSALQSPTAMSWS